jgi:hypothetical protein
VPNPDHPTVWPELTLAKWDDTRDTLMLWTQIVGKIRMALEPMINHWWQVTLFVTARGLTTSLMHAPGLDFEMEFDFVDHDLVLRSTDGRTRRLKLEPKSVAQFYQETMVMLDDLGIHVSLLARPVEVVEAIPFAQDELHHAYDADAAQRFWLAMVQAKRVLTIFRSRFQGKVSPVHYFWGGADLAVTRFSGRTAPMHPGGIPNCADWVQQAAYSHEVSSCGYWPGGGGEEGSFYAYAYPQPAGFADWKVEPEAAYYDSTMGEFFLPYEAVRTAADPDAVLLRFLQSTYEAAAELAHWDRAALEVAATGSAPTP